MHLTRIASVRLIEEYVAWTRKPLIRGEEGRVWSWSLGLHLAWSREVGVNKKLYSTQFSQCFHYYAVHVES